MKFASVRDFRINASKVLRDAETEEIIVTRRGHPTAMLIPVEEDEIDLLREVIARAKLGHTLKVAHEEAKSKGLDAMTMEDIDAEIKATRKERRT